MADKTIHRSMYFPKPQMEKLVKESEEKGITISALIVRIIDAHFEQKVVK